MIDKISPIQPVTSIPSHHLKWCGQTLERPKTTEKKHKISSGDLILYDKFGKKHTYSFDPEDEK
jgi:hypothetical protein